MKALISLLIICFSHLFAAAQTDSELMAEGRAALRNNDCPAARRAFESVSTSHRDSSWLDAVAQSAECMKDLPAALDYYVHESQLIVGSDRLSQKIGELRYKISLSSDNPLQPLVEWAQAAGEVTENLSGQQSFTLTTTLTIQSACLLNVKKVRMFAGPGSTLRITYSFNVDFTKLDPGKVTADFWNFDSGVRLGRMRFSDSIEGPEVTEQQENLSQGEWRNSGSAATKAAFDIPVSSLDEAQRGAPIARKAAISCITIPR